MFFAADLALGIKTVASRLSAAMTSGQLRRTYAVHAAECLMALLDAESRNNRHFALRSAATPNVRGAVKRAVNVFLATDGGMPAPDDPANDYSMTSNGQLSNTTSAASRGSDRLRKTNMHCVRFRSSFSLSGAPRDTRYS